SLPLGFGEIRFDGHQRFLPIPNLGIAVELGASNDCGASRDRALLSMLAASSPKKGGFPVTQSRPFGVTVLALLAFLQAIIAAYHTLQFLPILPFNLGPMSFFGSDLLAAALWAVTAAIYVWAGLRLWQLDIRGWMFAALMAGWILILDIFEAVGAT